MFSTCIFCNKPLGKNESLEAFPVGERLAFDPARGRLWVVCHKCERWNLTPLEERWEAIEQAERLYRDTRRRVSTDNIGLARLPDGTALVRIGEPHRPEFAAWRYGDQFGRRRQRAILLAGGGVAAAAALFVGGSVAGASMGSFAWMFSQFGQRAIRGSPQTVVARIATQERGILEVRRRHLGETTISQGDGGSLAIDLRFKNGSARFIGAEAQRIASVVLPQVNRYGGRKQDVAEAVREIESLGDSERFLSSMAERAPAFLKSMNRGGSRQKNRRQESQFHKYGLFSLPAPQRLALEMALHEETERRALEGELAELERSWRDAEEIASIADNLLVPSGIEGQLRKLKGGEES